MLNFDVVFKYVKLNDNCVVDVELVCFECVYMSMFGVCTKLMENDVVVVKLWMSS